MEELERRVTQLREENEMYRQKVEESKQQLSILQEQLTDKDRQYNSAKLYIQDLREQLDAQSLKLLAAAAKREHKQIQTENDGKCKCLCNTFTVQHSTVEATDSDMAPPNLLETAPDIVLSPPKHVPTQSETANNQPQEEQPAKKELSIAESLKQAAEEVVQQTGYVFDESSGLYYDYNSGYYYDAEKSLYYDPKTGTYFFLDPETQTYQFHSQVDVSEYYPEQQQQEQQPEAEPNMQDSWNDYKKTKQSRKPKDDEKKNGEEGEEKSEEVAVAVATEDGDGEKEKEEHAKEKKEKGEEWGSRDWDWREWERRGMKRERTRERDRTRESDRDVRRKEKRVVKRREFAEFRRYYREFMEFRKVRGSRYGKWARSPQRSRSRSRGHKHKKKSKSKDKKKDKKKKKDRESERTESKDKSKANSEEKDKNDVKAEEKAKSDIKAEEKDRIETNVEKNLIERKPEEKDKSETKIDEKIRSETTVDEKDKSDTKVGEKDKSETEVDKKDSDHVNKDEKMEVENEDSAMESIDDDKIIAINEGKLKDEEGPEIEDGEISGSDLESPHSLKKSRGSDGEDGSGWSFFSSSDSEWFTSDEERARREEEERWRHDTRRGYGRRRRSEWREVIRERKRRREEEERYDREMEEEMEQETNASLYPPCIRVMVHQSDHLDVGSLYIITCTGASLGRENGLGHTIVLPDILVSKMHCDFQYQEEGKQYVLKDHASQNGTLLNGNRISEPKTMSALCPLTHGDVVTVGGTSLLLHIHEGNNTCEECEPGLVQAQIKAKQQEENKEVYTIKTKKQKEQERKKGLKNIKKKFGLEAVDYIVDKSVKISDYEDKAEIRRQTKGSDNPYQKEDAPASVDVAISAENKGHKLLAKMGWKEGDSLGKSQPGITEPIQVSLRTKASAGLGSHSSQHLSMDDVSKLRNKTNWTKSAQRFDAIVQAEKQQQQAVADTKGLAEEGGIKEQGKKELKPWVKGETHIGEMADDKDKL